MADDIDMWNHIEELENDGKETEYEDLLKFYYNR